MLAQRQQQIYQHIMAFVFESDRNVAQVSKLTNPTGPGQYTTDSPKVVHSSAPFHSSSLRKTVFAQKEKDKPGPGEYDVSQPIVEPNIKSVSNSHSIILKINSTGTAQFKSTNTRFRDEDQKAPGPGKYIYDKPKESRRRAKSGNSERQIFKKMKDISQTQQNSKNVPAIPNKYRGLTDGKKEEEVPDLERLGPAHYSPNKTFHVNSTGTVWGKDKTRRFVADRKIALGPGQYKADYKPSRPDDKAGLSAGHFRSATTRTYFDSLIYKTNIDSSAKERAKSVYKSKEPAPGQYNGFQSSFAAKEKPFSFQFFGSTVQRFSEEEPNTQKPKKNAFYNIRSEIGKNFSFNRGSHGFNSLTERQNEFLGVRDLEKNPGPGQYKQKVVVDKKLKGAKVEKFGSTTDRPFYRPEQTDEMGPGKYSKDDNIEQFVKTRFGQVKNINSTFKSATPRQCFGPPGTGDTTKLAEYDLTYHDLSKKQERQKMFLENLKKIQVERPGFESSNTRFPHYQEPQVSPAKQKEKKMNSNREQEQRIKEENERARSVVIESNRGQLQEKKSNGYFDRQDRFDGFKRGTPGAGSYGTQESWQKKSYNVKYAKK